MKVKAVSVRAFELFNDKGESLGLFIVCDQWQGMLRLESVRDEKAAVIVDAPRSLDEVFGRVFGDHRLELDVVKASPDLAVLLK